MSVEVEAKFQSCSALRLTVAGSTVPAGFPSPADDYLEPEMDLNQLVPDPESTYLLRVSGDSMRDAGIFSGDLLVVDKAQPPYDGAIVVASLNGEFTLKRYRVRDGVPELEAANPNYQPIRMRQGDELTVWGVVRYSIKKH